MVSSFLTKNEFNTTKVQKKAKTTSLTAVTKWKNNLECLRAQKRLYVFNKSSSSSSFFYFNFERHIKHSIACKMYSNKMHVTIQDLLLVRI